MLGLVIFIAAAVALYQRVSPHMAPQAAAAQAPLKLAETAPVPAFKCDGRTHCSHMTSCEEATFFIQNCPNTQMDGNGDGEPCEQQWCY